jgi:lactate dehydrogenase-like 2-hydroxyacid dehydrogenase
MKNSPLPLVLVTHTLPEGWLDSLAGNCRMLNGPQDATLLAPELEAHLGEAIGLLTLLTISVTEDLLVNAPQLQVISNMAVGVDNIDLEACSKRGIPVGNTPDVLTEGTADLAIALLLGIARRLPEASQDAAAGRWQTWSPTGWLGADLSGASLGIVGMGKIGLAVAKRAADFGLNILYSDPNQNSEADSSLKARRLPLQELLEQSDFVSLHTPLTPQTRHLINEEALKLMKPSAILVNTARGPIVDTRALIKALNEGWINAAALDVTDPEPLPPDHQLYKLHNCLVTPHIGSATWNTRRRMAERACENLLAGLRGEKLPYCANPEVYRSKIV